MSNPVIHGLYKLSRIDTSKDYDGDIDDERWTSIISGVLSDLDLLNPDDSINRTTLCVALITFFDTRFGHGVLRRWRKLATVIKDRARYFVSSAHTTSQQRRQLQALLGRISVARITGDYRST